MYSSNAQTVGIGVNGSIAVFGTSTVASLVLSANALSTITLGTSGTVTIATPTSGVALTVNGVAGTGFTNPALIVQGALSASGSNGLVIRAGTNSSDAALVISNDSNSTTLMDVFGDGGVVVGAPTGSTLGLGTVNAATGFYINGNPIYSGTPINAQNGAYQIVAADSGKTILINSGSASSKTLPTGLPTGGIYTFINIGGGTVTLVQGSGATVAWSPSGATGNRSLAPDGVATAVQVAAGTYVLSGAGIT